MRVLALYFYERELLSPWLNHYCHLPCIDTIVIQNQNYSQGHSEHLYKTVAEYIDEFNIPIYIYPSSFTVPNYKKRSSQFQYYGEPKIRNRLIQHCINETWIMGEMDEVIYGESYKDTNRKLETFDTLACERAEQGHDTVGFFPLYSITYNGFIPGSFPPVPRKQWKHKIYHSVHPMKYVGAKEHDHRLATHRPETGWVNLAPVSNHEVTSTFQEHQIVIDLKLLHYKTLIRHPADSPEYTPFHQRVIVNPEEHPRHYFNKMRRAS